MTLRVRTSDGDFLELTVFDEDDDLLTTIEEQVF